MGKSVKRILSLVLMLCVFVSLPALAASAANSGGTYSYMAGDTVNFIKAVMQRGEKITDIGLVSGKLPAGVTYTYTYYDSEEQTYLVFSGQATEGGSYPFTLRMSGTYGGYEDWDFIFNVNGGTTPGGKLEITKDPTGETVNEGDRATFISVANNYSQVEWRIISPDGNSCWRGENEIESKFPGVSFSAFIDEGKEYLVLSNIPLSMNGCYVQTKFWGIDGSVTDSTSERGAKITVNEPPLEAPKITKQPDAAEVTVGTACTLECTATAKDGTVSYQWYKNNSNTTVGGQKIDGATVSKYMPEQTEGQKFYYCASWAEKNGRTSDTVYSNVVAVTYAPPATPSPSPTPSPSASPEATLHPADGEIEDVRPDRGGSGAGIFIVLLIASAVALAGVAGYLVYASKKSGDEENTEKAAAKPTKTAGTKPAAKTATAAAAAAGTPAPPPENRWRCPFCGRLNDGRYCFNCGYEKPHGAPRYACAKCGWKPADPTKPPKFCPECGDPFDEQDILY